MINSDQSAITFMKGPAIKTDVNRKRARIGRFESIATSRELHVYERSKY